MTQKNTNITKLLLLLIIVLIGIGFIIGIKLEKPIIETKQNNITTSNTYQTIQLNSNIKKQTTNKNLIALKQKNKLISITNQEKAKLIRNNIAVQNKNILKISNDKNFVIGIY